MLYLPVVLGLVGCAAGAPKVAGPPTVTAPPTDAAPTQAAIVLDPTTSPAAKAAPTRTVAPPTSEVTPAVGVSPSPTPRPAPPSGASETSMVVERGTSGRREIALTFDAGAERGDAELILDTLADYGVVASFGVSGQWAQENPDLMRRIVSEGHMVFNHTWSHRSWTGQSTASDPNDPTTWVPLTRAERLEELERAEAMICDLAGYEVRPYFRPAYADYDAGVLDDLAAGGYSVTVMWSCESLAWMGWTAEQVVAHCSTDMTPGDIILLHVTAQGTDSAALPGLIDALAAQDFRFVTVEQVVQP